MKVLVYVEGPSDRIALETLLRKWGNDLLRKNIHLVFLPLDGKAVFFKHFGPRAARNLVDNDQDLVVGLPDLYPCDGYQSTPWAHSNYVTLKEVQERLVRQSLIKDFRVSQDSVPVLLKRLCPSALKHDLEMLLLASIEQFRTVLGTTDRLGKWVHPVENQNQQRPPKRVVEELFMAYKKQRYRDTVDAANVLRKVEAIGAILKNESGQWQCPVFKAMLDWIGQKTGVTAYS